MATLEQATATLDRLARTLATRQNDIETFSDAYRGKFNLHYASDDFEKFFADRYSRFADNWTGIVADAPHERLGITGVRLSGQSDGDTALWDAWRASDADAMSDLAMLDAIVAKRAFALVWGSDDGPPTVTFEHPSQAIVEYDPETRKRSAGAKIWADDRTEFATLYLPDSVWKFERPNIRAGAERTSGLIVTGPTGATKWTPRQPASDNTWPLPNPMGAVPLVEFPNRPRLVGEPMSDIEGTLAMQHSINLLWAQLFTASDYASFPQRVVIGAEMPTVPVLDENGAVVGERQVDLKEWSVKRAQWLENPNAKIDSWQAADLKVWTDVIEIAVGHIAAQTRTPAHYLLIGGTIANVSGDAMKALETGLVKRTEEKTEHFGRAAREVFRLMALAMNEPEKAKAVSIGRVLWRDIENISESQMADSLSKKRELGYPLEYVMELDGLSPTEITRVMGMVEAEKSDPLLAEALRTVVTPDARVSD